MSTMRIAAVLLLLIGLSTAMVQAAPVSTTPTTTAISAPCCGVTTYDIVQSQLKPNIAHTVPHHNRSAIDLSPPEPTVIAREETGIVVLVRRKSLGVRIRAAFHVRALISDISGEGTFRTLITTVANGLGYVLCTETGPQNKAWYVLQ